MGRHEDPRFRSRGLPSLPVLLAAVVVLVVLAGGLVWWLTGSEDTCAERHSVPVTVAPEIEPLVSRLLADPQNLGDGACAVAEVTAQPPLQTVADLGALEPEALPRVWVPDSSLWGARVGDGVPVDSSGWGATSPIVLATSRAAADALGWSERPPTWLEALTSGRPLAVPDLAASAEGLSALAAVRRALGDDADADNVIVQAVLAARGAPPSLEEALAAARDGGVDAPLVPVSERALIGVNEGADDPTLVAVYPRDGSPALDYPVLRVGSPPDEERPAVDAVVRALTARAASDAAVSAGFRGRDGEAPRGAGPATGTQEQAPRRLPLDPSEVGALLARLSSLAEPSRLLAVFDISASMAEPVGDGTRATLARDAAKSALTLVPDDSAIALWVFARQLDGGNDWQRLVPMRQLGVEVDGSTQRELLAEQLNTLPVRLVRGGTGLYDTVLAAFRQSKRDNHPDFISSVVIITDGEDEDPGGIGLDGLLAALRAEADPAKPVKVIGIALGPDADLSALQQIAEATGGAAYSAVDPKDLQTVLFDALRQRR
jgi:hypothetical protein